MALTLRRFVLLVVGLLVVVGLGAPVGAARAEGVGCPNEQLRAEQPYGAGLPDCRAYEMVSPLEKGDSGVAYTDSRAAVSGEAVTYVSPGSFGEARGAAIASRYLARRGLDGWANENISPPYKTYLPQTTTPFEELLFTPELSKGVVKDKFTSLVGGAAVASGYINLFVGDTGDGSYQTVSDVTPPEAEVEPYGPSTGPQPFTAGVSSDLSRVVFEEHASLTEGASPGHRHVYEWSGGRLVQVDVAPAGMTLEGKDTVGAPNPGEPYAGDVWHAVSADGSRVFFTGGENEGAGPEGKGLGQLYVRENPEQPSSPVGSRGECLDPGDACTVEVSRSQKTNGSGPGGTDPNASKARYAYFRDASADGSRVFFTSRVELTDDANTGPEDDAANLYEYDLDTGVLSDLTVDTHSGDVNGADLLGVVTASEDGSYVYFVADGVLSEEANSQGERASPGDCIRNQSEVEAGGGERTCNLYVEHLGGSGWEAPRFIATLAGSTKTGPGPAVEGSRDERDWIGYEVLSNEDTDSEVRSGPGWHRVRVTPDGSRLAFESERSLTGYDNEPVEAGQCGETGRCREVYLYDAVSGKLVCVSCDPGNARPAGSAELGAQESDMEVGGIFEEVSPFYVQRNLSESGGRLFFQTPDALVPYDGNGLVDVYEWEQPAAGSEVGDSCTRSSPAFDGVNGGCVFPVSNVAGGEASHFMDASPSGNDVFIATADPLVAGDTDTRTDVYDVRVDGGFPAPTVASACVSGDACRGPVSPQPGVFGAPASATFSGAGDLEPPSPAKPAVKVKAKAKEKKKGKSRPARCGRGFARRHGRCVKSAAKSGGRSRKGKK